MTRRATKIKSVKDIWDVSVTLLDRVALTAEIEYETTVYLVVGFDFLRLDDKWVDYLKVMNMRNGLVHKTAAHVLSRMEKIPVAELLTHSNASVRKVTRRLIKHYPSLM